MRGAIRWLHTARPGTWPVLVALLVAPLLTGFVDGPRAACERGLEAVTLPDGRSLCTHGPDPAPGTAAADPGDSFASANAPTGAVPSEPAQCYDDGRAGRRVQVVYAHERGREDRSSALDGDLRRWVGQVEWTVVTSAAATGGRRHVRFVTGAAADGGCQVEVLSVELPVGAFASFGDTIDALANRGHARDDRKYLVFADVEQGACGTATVPADDRKAADNRANVAVGYARVDADCWRTGDDGYHSVAAHELLHTFGAVQASAPHATDGRHCTDEWDVMCYADGDTVSTTTRCRDEDPDTVGDADAYNRLLDCGHDDYFHTDPAVTSYLGRHWNTADSVYLSDQPSTGAGHADTRDVEADPEGRPRRWSGHLGSATIPLLPDAYGWESCDLPITVRIADGAGDGGALAGLIGGSTTPSSDLRDAVDAAAQVINQGVGVTVLTVDAPAWDGGRLAEGELGIGPGETVGGHHVAVSTRGARIRSGELTISAAMTDAPRAQRELTVLQGLVRVLGVGLTDTTGELTSRHPAPGADRTVALAALRHLYATPCSQDARLDDTVGGSPSQRVTDGTRERIDLAARATTPIAAAVDIATWSTRERGDGWADRAIVCRDDVHADCLAGTALARAAGPILFVPGGPGGTLPGSVRDVLSAALRVGADVHVLGGPVAVSDTIVEQLRDALPGRRVQRLAGADRYATAATVAHEVVARGGSGDHVILTRADDPADAVAAGAAAAERGVPIVLTATDRLPAVTQLTLRELGTDTVVVAGGTVAVSTEVEAVLRSRGHSVARLAGRDRFETAVAIARAPTLWSRTEVRASGSVIGLNGRHAQTWNLALAAAPVGAHLDAPVLFTTAADLPSLPRASGYAGGTLEQLRDLGVTAAAPTVRTVFVGAGTWAERATAERFHAGALPGFGGNVSVSSS